MMVLGCFAPQRSHMPGSSRQKSRIRETWNLSTDADSSTNTTVGWTENTQKPKKLKTGKKIQNGKTQSVVSPMFCKAKSAFFFTRQF